MKIMGDIFSVRICCQYFRALEPGLSQSIDFPACHLFLCDENEEEAPPTTLPVLHSVNRNCSPGDSFAHTQAAMKIFSKVRWLGDFVVTNFSWEVCITPLKPFTLQALTVSLKHKICRWFSVENLAIQTRHLVYLYSTCPLPVLPNMHPSSSSSEKSSV